MNRKKKYSHITAAGYQLMETLKPGSLIRVKWIEDTDDVYGAEWGLNMYHLDDENNVVMLVEWKPEIPETKGIINFTCLWEDKIYSSSTYALLEIL